MSEPGLVYPRLVLASAQKPDRAVGQVFESELDVGAESLRVKDVERRFRTRNWRRRPRREAKISRRCRARRASGSAGFGVGGTAKGKTTGSKQ